MTTALLTVLARYIGLNVCRSYFEDKEKHTMAMSGHPPSSPDANKNTYHAALRTTAALTPGCDKDVIVSFNDAPLFLRPSVPSSHNNTDANTTAWCLVLLDPDGAPSSASRDPRLPRRCLQSSH